MNKEKELKKLKIVTQRIVENYDPEKIILFGSYAWGKPNKDSDFDILIIKNGKKNFLNEQQKVRRIVDGEIALDILIATPVEVQNRLKMGDFFFRDIINKGKYVYAK
ncbi:MAG: nucleotidyltransferase domain-containing protein [Candidatus Peregrinibacteria bacterium]|nr:nucleotidyltransferase domain-containing protein [Candidatus Peregrinibacteria bacterium]